MSAVISGVPQGSVSGPFLFLIYINGKTQIPLNNDTSMLLYADDILLHHRVKTEYDYHICTLETGLLQNYLELNASKCMTTHSKVIKDSTQTQEGLIYRRFYQY